MLDALRRGAQGWLAKLLFSILVMAFAVWGIPHNMLNFGGSYLAKVGGEEISIGDFQKSFQNQLNQISNNAKQRITTEQALAYGLDRQVLERLVAQAAIKNHAQEMGLALSDQELVEGVRRDADFQGPDGKFSKAGFEDMVHQMGMTEQGFLALRRDDELRRQITEAMTSAVVAPAPLVEQAHAWNSENRVIEYVKIDPYKAAEVPDPDEAKLKQFYEDHKAQFLTSEYRKFSIALLAAEDLTKEFTFTDDELKTAYEETKASFDNPEKRRLQQISFKDKTAAEEARKALADGKKNFMDVAKEAGAKESDINLGMLTKKQLIDKKIADVAFSLPRDQVSEVVEGSFATVLVRAIEIEPGKDSTFDEVKEKVRDKLAKTKAESVLQERIDLVEESRNAGKTLKEIADTQKLKFVEVESADQDNKSPDGKAALDHPDATAILNAVFDAKQGAEQEMVDLPNQAYGWIDLIGVTEAKQKSFDDAKADLKAVYIDSEKKRLIETLAASLVDRLKGGQGMARIASDAFGTVETTDEISRSTSPPGLTQEAVKQAFQLPKGGAASAETIDRKTRVVFRVADIKPALAPTAGQTETITKDLKETLRNDLLLAYVDALKVKLGVSVKASELKRATGQGGDQ